MPQSLMEERMGEWVDGETTLPWLPGHNNSKMLGKGSDFDCSN